MLVEGQQTNAVALQIEEIGESAGKSVSILGLGIGEGTKTHRAAVINQEMASEIGLVLEFLDVIAIGSGVEPPIQISGVVAWCILAIFGKFDGKTVIRAAVESIPESFHHYLGPQLEVLY
jgi:hypothetical protein